MAEKNKQHRSLNFQNLNRKAYFEGWYYKQVSQDGRHVISFIPGINRYQGKTEAFVQIIFAELNNDKWSLETEWISFQMHETASGDEPFFFRIAENEFRRDGLKVKLHTEQMSVEGELRFSDAILLPSTTWMPTIMGPFSYLPAMECIHSVNSLSHRIAGHLEINGRVIDFSSGKGYLEKDWGSSFPKRYIWLQSNHFREDDASLFFSWADIPTPLASFEGYIVHLYYQGQHHRFATYTRGGIELKSGNKEVEILLTNAYSSLRIHAKQEASAKLFAPIAGQMTHSIKEGLFGQLSFDFHDHKSQRRLSDSSEIAGIELTL